MIDIENVKMDYPIPKRFADLMFHLFGGKWFTGLHTMNLKIRNGDCIAFLRANGAGKTTLLKLIGGLYT